MAKKALSNQLYRQHKLKRAESGLKLAKLVSSLLSNDTNVTTPVTQASPDTTRPPLQSLHASSAHFPISQQLPCPSSSIMLAIETAPEAQSTLRDAQFSQQPNFSVGVTRYYTYTSTSSHSVIVPVCSHSNPRDVSSRIFCGKHRTCPTAGWLSLKSHTSIYLHATSNNPI